MAPRKRKIKRRWIIMRVVDLKKRLKPHGRAAGNEVGHFKSFSTAFWRHGGSTYLRGRFVSLSAPCPQAEKPMTSPKPFLNANQTI